MERRVNDRITWIDVARGVGIFLIVLGHALQTGFIRQVLFSFHVPFFFFLAGLTYKREDNIFRFLKKKVKSLLIPYWVWGTISIVVFLAAGRFLHMEEKSTGLINNLWGLLYANPRTELMWWNRPLWFIPCLFASLMIVDIFERTIIRTGGGHWKRLGVIISFFIVGVVWNKFSTWILPFHFEAALGMVPFIEIGIIFRSYEVAYKVEEICAGYKFLIVLICTLLGVAFSKMNGWAQVLRCDYGQFPVLYVATSLLLGIAVIIISIWLGKNKCLETVGKWSACILLMHKFPILVFQRMIPITKTLLSEQANETPVTLLCGFIVAAISIGSCFIVGKIVAGFLPEIVGQKRIDTHYM